MDNQLLEQGWGTWFQKFETQVLEQGWGTWFQQIEGHSETLGGEGITIPGSDTTANLSIAGSSKDDILGGGQGQDLISGGTGDDLIDGKAGNDIILGDAGNDIIYGWTGDDAILGGAGDDFVAGEDGNDQIYGEAGHDILSGGRGDDLLDGGTGRDVLQGDTGNDVLLGGTGDDKLNGGSGNDLLVGGAGNDIVEGGTGDDILYGDDYFAPGTSVVVGNGNVIDKAGAVEIPKIAIPTSNAKDPFADLEFWMRLEAEDMDLRNYSKDGLAAASGGGVIATQGRAVRRPLSMAPMAPITWWWATTTRGGMCRKSPSRSRMGARRSPNTTSSWMAAREHTPTR
ncbi:MAG: calcium-binding protein [Leptolyngbya sp. RL_3_1]|nr:calcium-binding protein [Leptolyngbya sp. RL_3_1]